MKWIAWILLVIVFLCGDASAQTTKKLVAVCSTTQIADFARQVAGDQWEVKSILAPGADPHTYMPTPGDEQMVMSADLCLQNGLHLEGNNWMARLVEGTGKPLVVCTEGVPPLEVKYSGEGILDPHAWFSPRNAAIYVNNIVRALSRIDSGRSVEYQARAMLYLQQLRTLDGWVRNQVSLIPPKGRILVTSHDAFNYFCREYGFNPDQGFLSLAPIGWSTGSEVGAGMTPQRRREVIDSVRSFGARAIFVETSVNPKLIREIAREAGVMVGGELYSDSMGEAGSAGETYIGMMRENVITIISALRGEEGQ